MADISTTAGLYVQVNSALANPPAGILLKLTATLEDSPSKTLGGVRLVVTNGEGSASTGAVCALDGVARAKKRTTPTRVWVYFENMIPPHLCH
jgi:hypothetical protein